MLGWGSWEAQGELVTQAAILKAKPLWKTLRLALQKEFQETANLAANQSQKWSCSPGALKRKTMCDCPFALLLFSSVQETELWRKPPSKWSDPAATWGVWQGKWVFTRLYFLIIFTNHLLLSAVGCLQHFGEARLTWAGFQREFSRRIPAGTSGRWWWGQSWAPQCWAGSTAPCTSCSTQRGQHSWAGLLLLRPRWAWGDPGPWSQPQTCRSARPDSWCGEQKHVFSLLKEELEWKRRNNAYSEMLPVTPASSGLSAGYSQPFLISTLPAQSSHNSTIPEPFVLQEF